MTLITEYYRNKSRMDEKAAWIGKAFSGLRSRQMSFGGGEMLTVIELLKEEVRESDNAALTDIVEWMSHFELQQRGMFSRIDLFTELLDGDIVFQDSGPDELGATLYKTIADLPETARRESGRIHVSNWKSFRISLDHRMLEAVLRELLINALKFSPAESPIDIHCYISGQQLVLEIVNSCLRSSRIFEALESPDRSGLGEPFMGGFDFPRFQLPGHDLCIGLSFVGTLAHKLRGDLRFMDVRDYSSEIPAKRFAAVLAFPLLERGSSGFQIERLATISRPAKS
ncbi:MAG: ATP-binding protein [bacterium]|nr:ATP-binding protein [bacterium]